ncbi:MAG: 16S rRNA (adenine1518-N6/adenine1519-N6)-dimethyltransferase [Chlamydiales bacterium]|jgi:16S rRNA (adenine1518-N6/adenine1519-N6)-dimethyltransferase
MTPAREDSGRLRRPPWERFRAALEAHGFRPSRRLGQNFLLDDNQAFAIARDAGFARGDFVLEVGAGCGFLSIHLLELGARLLAIEIDPRLAEVAREFMDEHPGEHGAELILTDVLAGKHELAPEVCSRLPASGPWHLVSNLPYSVSAPVMSLCAARELAPESMTVLVQREVADRVAAGPDSRAWGPLSITLQVGYEARILRKVGPASFWPRPQIDSAVLQLRLRPDRPPAAERARLREFVGKLFHRRRQTLGRVLGDVLKAPEAAQTGRERADGVLAELGMEPGIRAEVLSIPDLRRLSEACWRIQGSPP